MTTIRVAFVAVLLISGCGSATVPRAAPTTTLSPAPAATDATPAAPPSTGAPATALVVTGTTGCGVDVRQGATEITMRSGSVDRSAIVRIPSDYSGDVPVPLLIDLHGHGGNGRVAMDKHGFEPVLDKVGAIGVFPTGLVQRDGKNGWSAGSGRDDGSVDDVAFIDALLSKITTEACIDPARIFVVGHSNGGGMTALLSCALNNRVAAFAFAGAAIYDKSSCTPSPAVSLLEIHGSDDAVVPYDSSTAATLSIPSWLQARREGYGCAPEPQRTVNGTATRLVFDCPTGALEHILLKGWGHSFPAERAADIWAWFEAQAKA
jgi:polyhydroxybutyrate depolymerase